MPDSPLSSPWSDAYQILDPLGIGGQGSTYRACRRSDQLAVVIKVLRADRDTDKTRRRMLREVAALRALSATDARVPQFVESNIDTAISDSAIRPFVAMHYINGRTLQSAQEANGPLSLASALDVVSLLLDTVEIAHKEETTHRDIKPANIVLRDNSYQQPFLIDFGLSFTQSSGQPDPLTSIDERIRNSFLSLPESELTGSELKREYASDLTQVAGILLFLLTGSPPGNLSPRSSEAPHRRLLSQLQAVHPDGAAFLIPFFDRAFQFDVENRFRTCDELRRRLQQLRLHTEGRLPDVDPTEVAHELKLRIATQNREYQLAELDRKHSAALADFRAYLLELQKPGALTPLVLRHDSTAFRHRNYRGMETLKALSIRATLSMKPFSPARSLCIYFFAANGYEVSLMFAEAHAPEKKGSESSLQSAPLAEVLSFYEWEAAHTEQLIRHFCNWFQRAAARFG